MPRVKETEAQIKARVAKMIKTRERNKRIAAANEDNEELGSGSINLDDIGEKPRRKKYQRRLAAVPKEQIIPLPWSFDGDAVVLLQVNGLTFSGSVLQVAEFLATHAKKEPRKSKAMTFSDDLSGQKL